MKTNETKNVGANNSNAALVTKKEAREIIRLAKQDCSTISGAVRNMCILFKDKDLLRATFLNEKVKNPKAKKRLSEIIKNRSMCVNILSTYSMQLDGIVCKKYVIAKAENGVTIKKYKLPENPLAGVRLKSAGFEGKKLFVDYKPVEGKGHLEICSKTDDGNYTTYCYVPKDSFNYIDAFRAVMLYIAAGEPDLNGIKAKAIEKKANSIVKIAEETNVETAEKVA